MATQVDAVQTYSLAKWHGGPPPPPMPDWEAAVWEFVWLLGGNQQILAVVADSIEAHRSEITVWTYLHSNSRKDRAAIYAAEAEILMRYPGINFDFNVVLRPHGLMEADLDGMVFFYKSDYGDANGPSHQGSA